MKAITQDKYGSADVLRLGAIERPTPSEREVLVRVQAAGIARGVLHVMTGEPYLMRLVGFGLLKPKNPVPGQDVAGIVTATGAGVTRFKSVMRSSASPRARSPSTPSPARTSSATSPRTSRSSRQPPCPSRG